MLSWMGIPLTRSQAAVAKTAAEHAAVLHSHADAADKSGRVQEPVLELLRGEYSGLLVPTTYGGKDIDSGGYSAALMELSYGDPSSTLVLAMHGAVGAVLDQQAVFEEMRGYYYELAAEGNLFCAAFSEPGSSAHDAESFVPSTVIAKPLPGGGYTIWGKKSVVTGWCVASHMLVSALVEGSQEVVFVMIDLGSDEARDTITFGNEWNWSESMRSTGSDSATFRGTRVGPEGVVLRTRSFLETVMVKEAARTFAYIAAYVGPYQRMLEVAEGIVKERVPNGKAQTVAHLPSVMISDFDHAQLLGNAQLALWRAFGAYDQRVDLATTREAFELMCRAKVTVAELSKSGPSLGQLATRAGERDPDFARCARDLRAGLAMPPNEWEARRLGGAFRLGLKPEEMLRLQPQPQSS